MLAGAYWVSVVLSHDLVQRPALTLQRSFGIERVHYVIAGLLAVALLVVVARIWDRLIRHPRARELAVSGALLIAMGWLVFGWVMVRSIESIHFGQYLLLGLVLTILLRNPPLAAVLATLGGLLDEAWQYFYLYPNQSYFDFNDVVLNATGVLFGVWLYALYRPDSVPAKGAFRSAAAVWVCTLFVSVVLLTTGVFTVYRQESGIALHRREAPTPERPVRYLRTNRWGNSSVRLHPYAGTALFLVIPLGALSIGGSRRRQ